MADVDITAGKSRNRKSLYTHKKNSTKVDLTPMVDLGFLLITFFMVTTAWTKPHVTNLFLPANGVSTTIGDSAVLTVLQGKDNKIFYYNGTLDGSLKTGSFGITNYSVKDGIGEILRQKQLLMDKIHKGGRKDLMVLIKPSDDAKYENLVSLLDEMVINKVSRFALVDIDESEKKLLKEKIR
ncbi:MAG TPA: biopolymer transporter ExbD [Puia sp.]|nr:biopolymer transporter ExbD [Puia sp.]